MKSVEINHIVQLPQLLRLGEFPVPLCFHMLAEEELSAIAARNRYMNRL